MAEISEKQLRIFQKGFNYSQDGPGNRLVYHLQGCNMHCPWCANPEGIAFEGCIMKKSGNENLPCKKYPLQEVIDEVLRSRALFLEGGGITLTGGEPTMQFEMVYELLCELKEKKVHTAIENNGSHERLLELLPYVDYLIMDFKHPEAKVHRQVTGIGNERIKENLKQIFMSGRQATVRIPLVKGFNTSEEALKGFLDFFQGKAGSLVTFEFLSYHEYGKSKWQQCGMEYTIKDGYVEKGVIEYFEKVFTDHGLHVIHS